MKTLAGHGTIVLTLMYVTLMIVDHYNPAMDFINNSVTKTLLLILCLFAVYNAVLVLSRERARVRQRENARRASLRSRRPGQTRQRP